MIVQPTDASHRDICDPQLCCRWKRSDDQSGHRSLLTRMTQVKISFFPNYLRICRRGDVTVCFCLFLFYHDHYHSLHTTTVKIVLLILCELLTTGKLCLTCSIKEFRRIPSTVLSTRLPISLGWVVIIGCLIERQLSEAWRGSEHSNAVSNRETKDAETLRTFVGKDDSHWTLPKANNGAWVPFRPPHTTLSLQLPYGLRASRHPWMYFI